MISNVRVIRSWADTDTDLSNRIPIEVTNDSTIVGKRAFCHTVICIIVAPSIVTQHCLSLIRTSDHALLILLGCISALRTHAYTGVVDSLAEEVLTNRAFLHASPGGVIGEVRRWAFCDAEVVYGISVPANRAVSNAISSGDITIGKVRTFLHANPSDIVRITTVCNVAADHHTSLGDIVRVSHRLAWAFLHTSLGSVFSIGELACRAYADASIR